MNRRNFIRSSGITAISLSVLGFMPEKRIILYGDGKHCDADAYLAWLQDKDVYWPDGTKVDNVLRGKRFVFKKGISIRQEDIRRKKICLFENFFDHQYSYS